MRHPAIGRLPTKYIFTGVVSSVFRKVIFLGAVVKSNMDDKSIFQLRGVRVLMRFLTIKTQL